MTGYMDGALRRAQQTATEVITNLFKTGMEKCTIKNVGENMLLRMFPKNNDRCFGKGEKYC